jgi:dTDP-4-dehydrorhamnose reductase
MLPLILVTGRNGQLGWELEQRAHLYLQQFRFHFTTRVELDLTQPDQVQAVLDKIQPDYILNCAAYTAVDKAEQEQEVALKTNANSVGEMAMWCERNGKQLITISTDYVFDGKGTAPYAVQHPTDPLNYYGYSKWLGEQLVKENHPKGIIVRTSWVYSTHGNNFVRTMLRLMKERNELNVVADQIGSPTYAADLANALIQVVKCIQNGKSFQQVYHYSNAGVISWYDFAVAIRDMAGLTCQVNPIPSSAYPTPAKRPGYSVMDCADLVRDFGIELKPWQESLQRCIEQLQAHV